MAARNAATVTAASAEDASSNPSYSTGTPARWERPEHRASTRVGSTAEGAHSLWSGPVPAAVPPEE